MCPYSSIFILSFFVFRQYTYVHPPPTVASVHLFVDCAFADVVFVVDSSSSITFRDPSNWPDLKDFLKDIVNSFPIAEDKTRVALVQFR